MIFLVIGFSVFSLLVVALLIHILPDNIGGKKPDYPKPSLTP